MKLLLLAVAFAMISTASSAATVFYSFMGLTGGDQSSIVQTVDGVTVTITASGGDITQNTGGLGVAGNPNKDSTGLGESLTFDFGSTLLNSISGFVFEESNKAQQVSISVAGVTQNYTVPAAKGPSFTGFDVSALITAPGATSFTITGLSVANGKKNGFQVGGIVVSTVPVPASGVLLFSALGLIYLRRRTTPNAA